MPDGDEQTAIAPAAVIIVPWSAPTFVLVKGVLHQPGGEAILKPETRDAILLAIVKARSWIDDLASGHVQSFAEIAQHEGKVERHVRLLAPLAFTPPEILAALIAGSAPEDLTVTVLAQTVCMAAARPKRTAALTFLAPSLHPRGRSGRPPPHSP